MPHTQINYEARPFLLRHHTIFSVSRDTEREAIQEIIYRLEHLGENPRYYGIFKQSITWDHGTCVSNIFEQLLPCPLEAYAEENNIGLEKAEVD